MININSINEDYIFKKWFKKNRKDLYELYKYFKYIDNNKLSNKDNFYFFVNFMYYNSK
jgi:hypothetical protein